MTQLQPYQDTQESLKELLIKNLPRKIKAGNEKENSNIFSLQTAKALNMCNFINFNSAQRISFMIFDFDTYNDKEATETFKTIDMFYDYIINFLPEPTYIVQTTKGFQFAYHLKNHIFTHQQKALTYLNSIKQGIIEKVECDKYGSIRNYGVWRNPLKHNCYFSEQINYELKDFKEFAVPKKSIQEKFTRDVTIRQFKQELLVKGNRNNLIFYATMSWAKNKKSLDVEDIFTYASLYNKKAVEPLKDKEIKQISSSVYKYYIQNKIFITSKNINEGAMDFPKISNLTYDKYKVEVKRRQRLSAKRTNQKVGKEKKKELMKNAREYKIKKFKSEAIKKIKEAIKKLNTENQKITITAIATITGFDRKTVKKYINAE